MKEQQQQIIESYVHAYNQFDLEGMTKDLTDEVVFENVSNGNVDLRTEGLAQFKQQAASAKQYFKERKQSITSWRFSESTVEINIDYHATLAMDLPNGLKSGDKLELTGTSVFEFADGKIKKITDKS